MLIIPKSRKQIKNRMFTFQVERTWDLVRDSGQRKLTSSFQNHCTLHSVPVGAKPLSPRQCAPSRSIYLSRRLNSHWEILVTTHHLQKWESQLRLRWKSSLYNIAWKFKNAPAFLLRGARHAIAWHTSTAHLCNPAEGYIRWGIGSTTDTNLFLTTYRGGSHLPSDIKTLKQPTKKLHKFK